MSIDCLWLLTFSDSDDDDDTAALMAELARIKQERAEEKARLVCVRQESKLTISGSRCKGEDGCGP